MDHSDLIKRIRARLKSQRGVQLARAQSPRVNAPLTPGYLTLEEFAKLAEIDPVNAADLAEKLADEGRVYVQPGNGRVLITLAEEPQPENKGAPISFDASTGLLTVRGKEVKMRRGVSYDLFTACFTNYGRAVDRETVLRIIGYTSDKVALDHNAATIAINEAVNRLRKKTGLSSKELIQSGGNITLRLQHN